jgi:hypothetical protein
MGLLSDVAVLGAPPSFGLLFLLKNQNVEFDIDLITCGRLPALSWVNVADARFLRTWSVCPEALVEALGMSMVDCRLRAGGVGFTEGDGWKETPALSVRRWLGTTRMGEAN